MSRTLSAVVLFASAALLSPIPLIATTAPAAAQFSFSISFDSFHDELAPYGDWYYHPRWGDVWRPIRVERDFQPYRRGYWVNTIEYGWIWNSDYPWGHIPFHYGRWVFDPYDGWLWVPGYVWAPAWVVWRQGGGNIGWFPMPPDQDFLAGYDVYRTDWDWNRGYFGYSDWYGPTFALGLATSWLFVDLRYFAARDYYRYARPRTQIVNIINNTTNVTNYITVNNRIINRSVDVAAVERATGRRIERVAVRDVVKTPITTVDAGRQVQVRERQRHGGDANASARERVRRLSAEEARVPVRERRPVTFQREQQLQQPGTQNRALGGVDRNQRAIQPRGPVERAQPEGVTRQRNAEPPQQQRAPAGQADIRRQQRNQAERQQRSAGPGDDAQVQQQANAPRQQRARAQQQQQSGDEGKQKESRQRPERRR